MAGPSLSQQQNQSMQTLLAPHMRQSLEVLQVPLLELETLIQAELEQNPTLEETPAESEQVEVEPGLSSADDLDPGDADFNEEFEILTRIDDDWMDLFRQNRVLRKPTPEEEERRQYFMNSLAQPESLQEHLLNQLALLGLDDEERNTGEVIIGSLDDDGYLTMELDDIAESTGVDGEAVRRALERVQAFDPPGVAARSLEECLLLQLDRMNQGDTMLRRLVRDHLPDLARHRYAEAARALRTRPEEVVARVRLIAALDPRPGRPFTSEAPAYVLPEVFVQKVDGEWRVTTNNERLPHLRISRHYRTLLAAPDTTSEVRQYIREKIRAGSMLIRSLGARQDTLRRIGEAIVARQSEFLERGITALRPLTMSQVAQEVGVHETTVSRAVNGKYMQTPRGTFEMRYFFTSGVRTEGGEDISNRTIMDHLGRLVAQEDPARPLSDQALADALKAQGIQVARRTVAKYRESLKILPSSMRRRR